MLIATPEGVELELTLAGVGSRFISAIIDFLIEGLLIIALILALLAFAPPSAAVAGIALGSFALIWGYHVMFETLASGRSPGKRAAGLRVVRAGGMPVRFRQSAVRNIVRLVDLMPPVTYGVGATAILVSRRNQRLGDLAAGTLVVRVRRAADVAAARAPALATPIEGVELWDVSTIGDADLVAVRGFLDRRHEIDPQARVKLAGELAGRLRARVAGPTPEESDERLLEGIAAAKASRG